MYRPRLGLLWLLFSVRLSGCTTVGKFYTNRIRAASYYVDRYCFEMPKTRIAQTVQWILQTYHFPIERADLATGEWTTLPVYMSQYSRNPNWGYLISLHIRVYESHGPIPTHGLPLWVFQGKQPPLPPYPAREKFKTQEAYYAAQQAFLALQTRLLQMSERGYNLMKQWEGCDLMRSRVRTLVEIKPTLRAYPLGAFDRLDKTKGCQIASDRSLEHAMLRVLAWRLGRLKFVPVMQYYRSTPWSSKAICSAPAAGKLKGNRR